MGLKSTQNSIDRSNRKSCICAFPKILESIQIFSDKLIKFDCRRLIAERQNHYDYPAFGNHQICKAVM
jgi:hypothetical protein